MKYIFILLSFHNYVLIIKHLIHYRNNKFRFRLIQLIYILDVHYHLCARVAEHIFKNITLYSTVSVVSYLKTYVSIF